MSTATKSIGCVDAAARIIGEKWTPQLLRCLANGGAVRFCQLQEAVGHINPRTLSVRLNTLEEEGIIQKTFLETNRFAYSLTERGTDMLPILRAMQRWNQRYRTSD